MKSIHLAEIQLRTLMDGYLKLASCVQTLSDLEKLHVKIGQRVVERGRGIGGGEQS